MKKFLWASAGIAASALGLWWALVWGDGAAPLLLTDPGEVVRYGLPIAKLIISTSGALVIGGLMVRLWALPDGHPAQRVLNLVRISSGAWVLSLVAYGLLSFLSVYATPLSTDEGFTSNLTYFLLDTELGQLLLISAGLAAAVSVVVALSSNAWWNALAFLLSIASLWPFAEMAHSGGSADHSVAVSALILHIVFNSIWVGGLVAVVVALTAGAHTTNTIVRYSTLALVSFVVVTASGFTSSWVRIGSLDNLLGTAYGQIVLVKLALTVALGIMGAVYRLRSIPRLQGSSARIIRLFVVETLLMLATIGVATGLGRTETPVDDTADGTMTAAEILTGRIVPEPWSIEQAVGAWRLDIIWVLFAVITTWWYLAGVRRMAQRGDHWPVSRTINWVFAMIVLVYATGGGVAVYGEYLFSVHMIGHMLLTMMVPISIVLAAPVTLVMRAVQPRHDGSRGGREWVLGIVHSRWVSIVGHPLIATTVFALSLIVFYYSSLLSWATTTHLGHEWMVVHFLVGGYLFIQALIGIDPTPHRTTYPVRFILLMGTMVFHAFFGLSLMMGESLLIPEWYGAMGRTWGDDPLTDQQIGGGIAWGVGEVPTLVLSAMVALSWVRSDTREQKRGDRKAQRDGDADLNDYNAMLDKLAQRDSRNASGI